VVWSVHHALSLSLLPPQAIALLQHRVPPTGYSPSVSSPTRLLAMVCSSSRTTLAWVLSMRQSPSGTDCSNVGPPWGHKSCQKTCSGMGSSPQTAVLASCLLLCGLSMGSQPPSGHIHLFWHGVLHGVQGGYLLHCGSPQATRGQLAYA